MNSEIWNRKVLIQIPPVTAGIFKRNQNGKLKQRTSEVK